MSDPNVQGQPVQVAPEEEAKFKTWLKEKYSIEDEPEKFKESYGRARKAAEELPKYHATLEALIQAAREAEEAAIHEPVTQGREVDEAREQEKLRLTFRADPYEGTRKLLEKQEASMAKRLEEAELRAAERADVASQMRDTRQRSAQYVRSAWPEAFDRNSELHKLGKAIYDREMTETERKDPRSFLIATERAAGRMGLPPMGKRSGVSASEDSSAQNVGRESRRPRGASDDPAKLTSDQKKYADLMKVSHKTYALMKKQRDEAKRKKDD